MQKPSLNRITQRQHLASKAVDYAANPDPVAYAPEDALIESYGQRGTPGTQDDAGNALRFRGATGLHQFAHLEKSYVKAGDKVKRGQPLAKMGYTGYTIPKGPGGAHLHYWVQTPNGYVYPENLYNETFIKIGEEEMTKPSIETLRIVHALVGGWDIEKSLRGDYDKQFTTAAGWKDINSFIYEQFATQNGGKWRSVLLDLQKGKLDSDAEKKLKEIREIIGE